MAGAATVEPGRAQSFSISEGPDGVKQTLYLMKRLARRYQADPFITTLARQILADVPAKNWRAEVIAIGRYVQREIRYTQDPRDVEHLTDPVTLLRDIKSGDCDDMALAIGALLLSVNHPARFVACGFDYEPPYTLSHVFVQSRVGDHWLTLDASEPYAMGWEPPNVAGCFVVNA